MQSDNKVASYEALGLPTSSNEAEILFKYRELALYWYPERHEHQENAINQFKIITEAAMNLLFEPRTSDEPLKLEDLYAVFQDLFFEESDYDSDNIEYNEGASYKAKDERNEAVASVNARKLISEDEEEKLIETRKKAKNKKKREKKKQLKRDKKQNSANEQTSTPNILEEKEEATESNKSDSEEEIDPDCAFVAVIARKQKGLKVTTNSLLPKDGPRSELYDYWFRANDMVHNGHIPEAIDLFSKSIELDPSDYRLYSNRSLCFCILNVFDKALEDADKCIGLCPSFPKGYYRKGKALLGLKKYASAEECFNKALNLDSSDDDTSFELYNVQVLQITEMGFTKKQAKTALAKHSSVEESIESLLCNQLSQASAAEGYDIYASDNENEDFWRPSLTLYPSKPSPQ